MELDKIELLNGDIVHVRLEKFVKVSSNEWDIDIGGKSFSLEAQPFPADKNMLIVQVTESNMVEDIVFYRKENVLFHEKEGNFIAKNPASDQIVCYQIKDTSGSGKRLLHNCLLAACAALCLNIINVKEHTTFSIVISSPCMLLSQIKQAMVFRMLKENAENIVNRFTGKDVPLEINNNKLLKIVGKNEVLNDLVNKVAQCFKNVVHSKRCISTVLSTLDNITCNSHQVSDKFLPIKVDNDDIIPETTQSTHGIEIEMDDEPDNEEDDEEEYDNDDDEESIASDDTVPETIIVPVDAVDQLTDVKCSVHVWKDVDNLIINRTRVDHVIYSFRILCTKEKDIGTALSKVLISLVYPVYSVESVLLELIKHPRLLKHPSLLLHLIDVYQVFIAPFETVVTSTHDLIGYLYDKEFETKLFLKMAQDELLGSFISTLTILVNSVFQIQEPRNFRLSKYKYVKNLTIRDLIHLHNVKGLFKA
jgi:hypothetical protein